MTEEFNFGFICPEKFLPVVKSLVEMGFGEL